MQTIKGKRYFAGRKFTTIIEMLRQTVEGYGDNDVYLYRKTPEGSEIHKTYKQFLSDIEAFGTALLNLGLSGTNISTLGENRYEWAVSSMAVVNGVGVSVPIDKLLPFNEVETLLVRGEAVAYVFSPKFYKDAADIATRNQNIKYFICMDMADVTEPKTEDPRFIDMQGLIADGYKMISEGDRSFLDAKIDVDVMCSLLFTSGTTSMSKGVMLSQKNICSNIYGVTGVIKIPAGTRSLSVLPMHHTFENTGGMYMMYYYACTICFTDGLRFIAKNLSEWKINNLLAVPLLFENIYKKINDNIEKSGKAKLIKIMIKLTRFLRKIGIDIRRKVFKTILDGLGGHVELFVSGAAAADPKVVQAFTDWGLDFFQGYGLTETSPVLSLNNTFVNVIGSIGHPIADVELAIDTDDTKPGAIGEILAKGENIMLGYYKNPEATAETIREDGWMHTGDMGYFDKHGCIHITGRIKSMIVLSNGKKCFPEEIEALMLDVPGLKETIVWGENSGRGTVDVVASLHIDREALTAIVGSADDKAITTWLAGKIKEVNALMPDFKNIKYFVITEGDFAKTTTLKIKRNVVVDEIHAKLNKLGTTMRESHLKDFDSL